ncbi:ABC transporter ATP-binding protein [Mesorhizobium sp. CAU 1732]|uniref:ABC transporter ATP-binding protein n=1 Tax=Mesorhizobium sp. CAU 1732 TaxID=3140358 RepID=UPI0032613185
MISDTMDGRHSQPVLQVKDLNVRYGGRSGDISILQDVDLAVMPGQVTAVVGESGSGKSTLVKSIMGLLPANARLEGSIDLAGVRLDSLKGAARRKLNGSLVSLISQDALNSLNPSTPVGYQIAEMLMVHEGRSKADAMAQAVELLARTGIPDAEKRARLYPHEFSGGMRQRALIAMAICLRPKLLLADEPTTALDATVKLQVVKLIEGLRRDLGLSVLLVTHDMGIVAAMADNMIVMYAGRAVESGAVEDLFANPRHPYTAALIQAVPSVSVWKQRLRNIPGAPPSPPFPAHGCAFEPRCGRAIELCASHVDHVETGGRTVRCNVPL